MKTLKPEMINNILKEFVMSDDEMINVRGGGNDGEPTTLPSTPPIKI